MSNSMPNHVPFKGNLFIDPSRRAQRFDNGRSKAYEAYDSRNSTKKYIAIIAESDEIPRCQEVSLYEALVDTSFMHLVHTGVVEWPLDNSQRLVFIYVANMGDPILEGGSKFSNTTWRHPDIVQFLIQPMANMLKEMRDKNFSHGAIRPENIFLCGNDKAKPVILGDCLSTQVNLTQKPLFLPPNIAMAEPLGRGNGGIKGDIYAFGVTLLLFLRKTDELEGLTDEQVIKRKMEIGSYAALIGKERFQASFLELLRGVLHDDADLRWGVDEILFWLDGTRMTPAAPVKRKKANRPFIFGGKKYLYAEFLALHLHKNPDEAMKAVKDDSLKVWLEKAVGDDMIMGRFEKMLERVQGMPDNPSKREYLIAQLEMALHPGIAIHFKGRCFTPSAFGSMLARDMYRKEDLEFYIEVLNLNILDHFISAAEMPQAELVLNLKLYDACRGALKNSKTGYGIERCLYTLCPNTPCLSPVFKNKFVFDGATTLQTFEEFCEAGGQIALMMDKHLVAFFSVRYANFMDRYLYDLTAPDKNTQIAGNLHFMAGLQKRESKDGFHAMAKVFLDALSGVYNVYRNRELRDQIKRYVEKAAREGDLVAMSNLLDNTDSRKADDRGFRIAMAEYKLLQDEYNEYNRRLANKKTYGVANGREASTVVSWLVATAITVIVVLAFLSGNQMF